MSTIIDPKRELLRHTVSTLAYRGGKVLRDAPDGFSSFRIGETTRTPAQILAHTGDLLDWALSLAIGDQKWCDSTPLPWELDVLDMNCDGAVNMLDLGLFKAGYGQPPGPSGWHTDP